MAFRRRVIRRRAPPRRRSRRVIRRRRLRKRTFRRRTGNFTLKVRKTAVLAIDSDKGYSYSVAPTLNDYDEAAPYLNYFESYRIWNTTVKVTPLFNVASPTEAVPRYYSAPWHRAGPASLSTGTILSLDKAKSHNGTSGSFRRYTPAILLDTSVAGTPGQRIGQISWRPKIALQVSSTSIPHYCALYHWSIDQLHGGQITQRQYEIEISSTITFYTQKSFQG